MSIDKTQVLKEIYGTLVGISRIQRKLKVCWTEAEKVFNELKDDGYIEADPDNTHRHRLTWKAINEVFKSDYPL